MRSSAGRRGFTEGARRRGRLVGLAMLLAGSPAVAEPAASARPAATPEIALSGTAEGRIVGVEEGRLVVDVGHRGGAVAGDVAELWRPLLLRHPVTGRVVSDRYRTGSVRITEVLEVVSFAEAQGTVRQPPRPGDIVIVHVVQVAPPPSKPASGVASTEAHPAPGDAHAVSAAAVVDSLRGKQLADRIQMLEAWLRGNPSNRFAPALGEQLYLLRQLASGEAHAAAPARAEEEAASPAPSATAAPYGQPPAGYGPAPVAVRFQSPSRARAGESFDLGVEIMGEPRGMLLQSKNAEEVSYVTTPMTRAGRGYWVARVPAERLRAPSLEYFMDAVRDDGISAPLVASAEAPFRILVEDPPSTAPPLEHRSTASVYTDFADYNRLRDNDRVWQTEGTFGMRFKDVGVRAVRSGFGVYRGIGGSIDDLDVKQLDARSVGLTYGHLESELGFSQTTSLIVRLALGLQESGVSGGGQLHLRIGSDLDTNLTLGGELLGGIGLKGVAQLELEPKGRVPVLLRTEVTNQPAGGVSSSVPGVATGQSEVGGRVIVQAGYRILPPFVLFGRLSYQGRTIVHAGPGFGGGAQYEW